MRCGVLGAGSFGTALASVLLKGGHDVTMWCFEDGHSDEVNEAGRNTRYMTDFALPGLRATSSLQEAVAGQGLVLFVSPSHVTRQVARSAAPYIDADSLLVCATKGIESTGETMDEVLREELPEAVHGRLTYLSGPSFAREVLEEHPTAVVVAGRDEAVADAVQTTFALPFFRVYASHDVTGVELGGAIKNIIAIAAGCSDGLGFGHNARAAIITRGLAEMSRLGVACGAEPLTFMGLAGMGDLVLTCTGDLSRNRTVGKGLGSGMSLSEVTESLGGQVAEGVRTTASTALLAQKVGMEMPLVEAVRQVLYEDRDPREVVAQLMGRPLKRELD